MLKVEADIFLLHLVQCCSIVGFVQLSLSILSKVRVELNVVMASVFTRVEQRFALLEVIVAYKSCSANVLFDLLLARLQKMRRRVFWNCDRQGHAS